MRKIIVMIMILFSIKAVHAGPDIFDKNSNDKVYYVLDAFDWLLRDDTPPNPKINISGKWHDKDWGTITFDEANGIIYGMLGNYLCEGVIRGNVISLIIYADRSSSGITTEMFEGFKAARISVRGEAIYTMVLVQSDENTLVGAYNYDGILTRNEKEGYKIIMKRGAK